jgi:periplasmic copper chaperone A
MKRLGTLVLVAGLTFFHTAIGATENTLVVRDAWVREAPPNAQVLAAYAQIENTGDQADAVVAVSSDAFEKAELHHSEVKDGVARMAKIKRLDVPVHTVVKLEPGGTHVMLFHPKSPLRAGQHVALSFTLSSGKTLAVDAEVRNTMQPGEHHHH